MYSKDRQTPGTVDGKNVTIKV